MPESINLLREFDDTIINKLQESYAKKTKIDDLKGITISHEPFTHCVIQNLVSDPSFVSELNSEIQSKLKYHKKNNDLYQFHQTQDLGKNKSKYLSKFRDQFLYGQFLEFLKKITNINLSSTKIDVTSSKYEFSDYLLCHDDNINQDQHGRRIAFIYYLVPEDWCEDGSDGGNLDLFRVNEHFEPVQIVKSLIPRRNSLAFFEVSDSSFHQVAEILSKNKTRLSINGWFHGPVNPKAKKKTEILSGLNSYESVEPDIFFEWITERYLKPINQTGIQMKFSSSSEIKLDKIFHFNISVNKQIHILYD
ncbi:prolyl 3-hydroxylase OGFOD1 [Brachionus plicatilis]|uniref:Prolyl 3-hydroxylase OGFOD1 n=1 Tax=Brachionus plicatilis TaxID=10195 RepID=A0A3M7QQN2_BRAPC|nr:prolyl 3-hydroxylase OGFOD1 [Brachionus plicatilis]